MAAAFVIAGQGRHERRGSARQASRVRRSARSCERPLDRRADVVGIGHHVGRHVPVGVGRHGHVAGEAVEHAVVEASVAGGTGGVLARRLAGAGGHAGSGQGRLGLVPGHQDLVGLRGGAALAAPPPQGDEPGYDQDPEPGQRARATRSTMPAVTIQGRPLSELRRPPPTPRSRGGMAAPLSMSGASGLHGDRGVAVRRPRHRGRCRLRAAHRPAAAARRCRLSAPGAPRLGRRLEGHPADTGEVHLGPGVGVLAVDVVEPVGLQRARREPDRDPGRDAERPGKGGERAGELLAVAPCRCSRKASMALMPWPRCTLRS